MFKNQTGRMQLMATISKDIEDALDAVTGDKPCSLEFEKGFIACALYLQQLEAERIAYPTIRRHVPWNIDFDPSLVGVME